MKTFNIKKLSLITALMLSMTASSQAYVTINSDVTDYTFASGTTYYITANIELCGSCVMEGGAVLKFASGTSVHVAYTDDLTCDHNGTVYLTAKDDNTVGQTIFGSTGSPSGYYYNFNIDSDVFLDNFHVNYCNEVVLYGPEDTINYCTFVNLNPAHPFYVDSSAIVNWYGDYMNGSAYPLYTTINSDQTDFTFENGTTYYITTGVNLYGSCVMEGGAVIKFAPSTWLHLDYDGDLACDHNGTVYLTSKDDNTVGATLLGSGGSPSGYHYQLGLDGDVVLDNCNIKYCSDFVIYGTTDSIYYSYFYLPNTSAIYNGAGSVSSYGNYVNGSPYSF